jgi:hypothetical protein
MDRLDTIARHNRFQDSMVYSFESHLREIVLRAQGRVIARLEAQLTITDGVIESTPANMLALRNAGKLFMQELDRAGYQRLASAFVGEFRGTLPFLQETLETLGTQIGQNWGRQLGFTARDFNLLGAVQANTVASLADAIQATAGSAITRGLFGVGGLRFRSLVDTLSTRLEMSIGRATTIADTSMSVWYATASERAFQLITRDLPEQELRYRYTGPVDKLERPFCRHLTDADRSYTRAQIDRMNNGQFPAGSVFITRGGFRCRHQWDLSTQAMVLEKPEAAA